MTTGDIIVVFLILALIMGLCGILPQFLAVCAVFFVAFYGIQWLVLALIDLFMAG